MRADSEASNISETSTVGVEVEDTPCRSQSPSPIHPPPLSSPHATVQLTVPSHASDGDYEFTTTCNVGHGTVCIVTVKMTMVRKRSRSVSVSPVPERPRCYTPIQRLPASYYDEKK